MYTTIWGILQELGEGCGGFSDCGELVGWLLTGDNGVGLPFVLLEQLLDHKISHVYDQQVHEII